MPLTIKNKKIMVVCTLTQPAGPHTASVVLNYVFCLWLIGTSFLQPDSVACRERRRRTEKSAGYGAADDPFNQQMNI